MKRVRIAVAVVCLVIIGYAGMHYLRDNASDSQTRSNPPARATSHLQAAADMSVSGYEPRASMSMAQSEPGPHAVRPDFRKALTQAKNYYPFVQLAFGPAKAGDRNAQYYLSSALGYCKSAYRFHFWRRSKWISLDETLHWASTRAPAVSSEDIQIVYDRCHELLESNPNQWGTAADWLGKATDAGQPEAQAASATKLLIAERVTVDENGSLEVKSKVRDPHALLRSAVASRDPAVLFQIGEFQGMLDPVRDRRLTSDEGHVGDKYPALEDRLAWWLVACQRGYECGASTDWHRNVCQSDTTCQPGETGLEYIRRTAQLQNYYDLDERANVISEKLDAGAWDELGLGFKQSNAALSSSKQVLEP